MDDLYKKLTREDFKDRSDLKDLVLIGLITILAILLTQALGLVKVLNRLAQEYEEWPILDFITVPTIMSVAFGIYAFRRWKELRQITAEAEKATIAKSQFLANMSHEIRTPMNAIVGFTQILVDEKLTDEQKEYIEIIQDSSRNLLRLIDDILDLSRVEAGKIELEVSEYPLRKLLTSVESLMRPRAKRKNLRFEFIEEENLPARLYTDPVRLRQCLLNLVSNAIKFTKEGHVLIKVSLQQINNKDFIRFEVEDTGIGIPDEKQEEVFNSFVQADGTHTREFDGTGLGLSITKKLVELLGGELNLKSQVGKGTTFMFSIPIGLDMARRQTAEADGVLKELDDKVDDPEKIKYSGNVLVAEDSRTNQMLIKLLLEQMGFTITIAEDGKQVLEITAKQSFDLIFMDIQMPKMNGYEATQTLRARGVTTPIIALTAYAMKGDREKSITAGCNDHLTKPIDRNELMKTIRRYFFTASEVLTEKITTLASDWL